MINWKFNENIEIELPELTLEAFDKFMYCLNADVKELYSFKLPNRKLPFNFLRKSHLEALSGLFDFQGSSEGWKPIKKISSTIAVTNIEFNYFLPYMQMRLVEKRTVNDKVEYRLIPDSHTYHTVFRLLELYYCPDERQLYSLMPKLNRRPLLDHFENSDFVEVLRRKDPSIPSFEVMRLETDIIILQNHLMSKYNQLERIKLNKQGGEKKA